MNRKLLVQELFGRFQNLNLVILREDLRRGLAARGDWLEGGDLCPLAHGLSGGAVVERLRYLSQAVHLEDACLAAGLNLGVHPDHVFRFVCLWDDSSPQHSPWLLEMLDDIWEERLLDAEAVQNILLTDEADLEPEILSSFLPGDIIS